MTNAQSVRTAREKAAQLRAEAERDRARRRSTLVTAVVAVVAVLVVGAVVAVQQFRHDATVAAASAPSGVPRNTLADGGIVGVFPGATAVPAGAQPVTVELWEDFQCPACRAFEAAQHATLERWAQQGVVRIVYKPVAFLDRASTTQYSSRALAAAAAVADSSPQAFPAFHDLLYAHQPVEGSAGLTDAQLVQYATQAGASGQDVAAALASGRYAGWVVQRTEDFSTRLTSTPTVLVDGTVLPSDDPDAVLSAAALRRAVATAAAAHGLPAPN